MSDDDVNPDVFTALAVVNIGWSDCLCDVRQITMWMLPSIVEEAVYMDCLLDTINYIGSIRPGLIEELYQEVLELDKRSKRELQSV